MYRRERQMRALMAAIMIAGVIAAPGGLARASEVSQAVQLAQAGPPKAGEASRQAAPPQPGPAGGIDSQIADLKRRLTITPAQQAQFDALAQTMRQNAQDIETLVKQEQPKGRPNAVDAVRAAGRFAEAEAAGMKRLLPPLQALYDSLSDPQKRAADQVFASAGEPEQPQSQGKKR